MSARKKGVVPPAAPRLLPQLNDWVVSPNTELDLEHCLVRDCSLSQVERLDADNCRLSNVQLQEATIRILRLSDIVMQHIEAAGLQAYKGSWLRAEVKSSRLTGADLGESSFEDCVFSGVKLDDAGLRYATFKRVRFTNCVLRGTDFTGARLSNVSFDGCDLEGAVFDAVVCAMVDLRSEDLTKVKGVLGLRGATIANEQLMQLAPVLAQALGLDVDFET